MKEVIEIKKPLCIVLPHPSAELTEDLKMFGKRQQYWIYVEKDIILIYLWHLKREEI